MLHVELDALFLLVEIMLRLFDGVADTLLLRLGHAGLFVLELLKCGGRVPHHVQLEEKGQSAGTISVREKDSQ